LASDVLDQFIAIGPLSDDAGADSPVAGVKLAEGEGQVAELTIDIGHHVLRPNTPDQVIPIRVTGGQPVQGVVFNIQLTDGYPDVPGSSIDGPNITAVDLVGPGTVFGQVANTGHNFVETREQIWVVGTATSNGAVDADGVLAYVTIDTTGRFGEDGPWEVKLTGTFNGDTSFQSLSGRLVASVVDGSIEIQRWHNPGKPADVNRDGVATPLDVLQVVNAINVHGPGELSMIPAQSRATLPCIDTNNDGKLTPVDALQVIKELNRSVSFHGPSAGEGDTRSWHNESDPYDVNSDGSVTPLDLLIVVNEINETGPRELNAASAEPRNFMVDVSGDNRLTPLDIIQVLNHLAGHDDDETRPGGPGESDLFSEHFRREMEMSEGLVVNISEIAEDVALAWRSIEP